MKLIQQNQFKQLFINNTALLDVRAPVEFSKGAFPTATNLPILNDMEREQVGTCYKQQGQQSAIELGHKLVSGELKQQRIDQWITFVREHPEGALYCFRGGMRSQLAQQWLKDADIDYPKIAGGYKALRNYLLGVIDDFSNTNNNLWVIGGRTGSGKTRVIHAVENSLDLEGYAHHRGSAFGKRVKPQPSQIDFDNLLAINILKKSHQQITPILVEDESKLIGRNLLPPQFKNHLQKSDIILVEEPMESRVQVVIDEYVVALSQEHLDFDPVNGWKTYSQYLLTSLHKVSKRLGDALYNQLNQAMEAALEQQRLTSDPHLHQLWIEPLLKLYYDKMYDYQLNQKIGQILFKGTREEVIEFIHKNAKTS